MQRRGCSAEGGVQGLSGGCQRTQRVGLRGGWEAVSTCSTREVGWGEAVGWAPMRGAEHVGVRDEAGGGGG